MTIDMNAMASAAPRDSQQVAVITGAGSGIGRAVAIRLADQGWRLSLIGRRQESLDETRERCADPTAVLTIAASVTDEQAVDRAFAATVARFGQVDMLFNNAGTFPPAGRFDRIGLSDWQATIETNLTGAFLCARAAFRHMLARIPSGGRIINNGSLSARVPRPHAAAYTASKHAVTGLTKAILLDGRAHGIVCSQIDIGNAATSLAAGFSTNALQADGRRVEEPMMACEDVANAVAMIANLPLAANIPFMTLMASGMPFVGRG